MAEIAEAFGPSDTTLRNQKRSRKAERHARMVERDRAYAKTPPPISVRVVDGIRYEMRGMVPCSSGGNPVWTMLCNGGK